MARCYGPARQYPPLKLCVLWGMEVAGGAGVPAEPLISVPPRVGKPVCVNGVEGRSGRVPVVRRTGRQADRQTGRQTVRQIRRAVWMAARAVPCRGAVAAVGADHGGGEGRGGWTVAVVM